jgi:phosphomannomutase
MSLITSISGIRGTIGGKTGENLTPLDIVSYASAYSNWVKRQSNNLSEVKLKIAVGRDARPSGRAVQDLVVSTLTMMGIDVLDLGLSTTPTVEMIVLLEKCHGGIVITASHNPVQWNALKLLNSRGEFLSASDGEEVLDYAKSRDFDYCKVSELGNVTTSNNAIAKHINEILKLDLVDINLIKKCNFKIAVDAVNSTGGIAVPMLLDALGVKNQELLYCEPNGEFPHNPEPLEKNLHDICELVKQSNCDLGVVVDPDVDRLVFVSENGELFGEEYTLVTIADYILSQSRGNCVSNLSSSRALSDIAQVRESQYFAAAVGEVNVVEKMKECNAQIGGEGNGGIIYPPLHYGRDALVGIALFLTYLAKLKIANASIKVSSLRSSYTNYFMAKEKIDLSPVADIDKLLNLVADNYKKENVNRLDGVKIDFEDKWVHLRKSNTEPIIRIYTEAKNREEANDLAVNFVSVLNKIS